MLPAGSSRVNCLGPLYQQLDDDLRGSLYESLLNPSPESDDLRESGADRSIRIVRDYLDGRHGPVPGWENWRERLAECARNLLPEDDRFLFGKPSVLRSAEEGMRVSSNEGKATILRSRARDLIAIDGKKIAEQLEGDDRLKAEDLCDRLEDIRYRGTFSSIPRDARLRNMNMTW